MQGEREQNNSFMLPVVLAIVIIPLLFMVLACGGFIFLRLAARPTPPAAAPATPVRGATKLVPAKLTDQPAK